jgi:hypothetical protein
MAGGVKPVFASLKIAIRFHIRPGAEKSDRPCGADFKNPVMAVREDLKNLSLL